MPYMKVKHGDEWCVHKKGEDGMPMGDSMGCHETEAEADAQIRAIEADEGDMEPMMRGSWRFVDEFKVRNPREFFRILPVGKFNKFGRMIEITPDVCRDMIHNFRLVPPTALPVNREHMEEHGRVGVIDGLQQRGDGLYALVNWTPVGEQLLREDSFGYFSPEIIWGPEDYEGRTVKNVLYGLALTNHPYFGEATAIYTLQDLAVSAGPERQSDGGSSMDEATVVNGLWDRFVGLFREAPAITNPPPAPAPAPSAPAPAVPPGPEPVPYGARLSEKATIEKLTRELAAERARNRQNKLVAVMGEEFRSIAEKLALIDDMALADELAEEFAALRLQADESLLFGELGAAGGSDEGLSEADRYLREVERQQEAGKTAAEAHAIVARENPALYQAYRRASARGKED